MNPLPSSVASNFNQQDSNTGNISEVADWCGKNFGELRGVRTIDSDLAPFLGPLQSTSSKLPEFASSSLHKIS